MLGSTADTCSASVSGVFHIRELVDYGSSVRFSTSFFFSAFAWFNSGYKFMRQSTWLVFLVTTHLALYSFVVLRPLNIFDVPFWRPGAFMFLLVFLNGKVFGVLNLLIFKAL